jgi:ADP-ribose pyrophosphatase YjhB (NUDIX family)
MDPVITVKAFAVLTDAARSRHLVWVARDETKQPATFHRLLGGHVEFGELAAQAVVREIAEELHVELDDVAFLGVLENVFRYAGAPGHEVVFVYGAVVADETVPDDGGWFDDGGPIRVEWRSIDEESQIPLYPGGTQALLDAWVARTGTATP